jgi:hypothetical protein
MKLSNLKLINKDKILALKVSSARKGLNEDKQENPNSLQGNPKYVEGGKRKSSIFQCFKSAFFFIKTYNEDK